MSQMIVSEVGRTISGSSSLAAGSGMSPARTDNEDAFIHNRHRTCRAELAATRVARRGQRDGTQQDLSRPARR